MSTEFQHLFLKGGIIHKDEAPYHPATNKWRSRKWGEINKACSFTSRKSDKKCKFCI